MKNDFLDLVNFIPEKIVSGKKCQQINLNQKYDNKTISLSYITHHFNNGWKEHFLSIPRFIPKSNETFLVLGLLQAECSKTQRGCFTFSNNEPRLINYVTKWFEKELNFNKENWRWYIKININEPENLDYKENVQEKVVNFWTSKTGLPINKPYPKITSAS